MAAKFPLFYCITNSTIYHVSYSLTFYGYALAVWQAGNLHHWSYEGLENDRLNRCFRFVYIYARVAVFFRVAAVSR